MNKVGSSITNDIINIGELNDYSGAHYFKKSMEGGYTTEKTVLLKKEGNVGTIILNRPKALNSFNQELIEDFHQVLDEVKKDEEIRVVILTGNGKAFSAGGDLFHLEQLNTPKAGRNFIVQAGELISTIMKTEKPFIAMVNGVAAGAGFNLALACDIIFSAKSARFGQSFVNVGLVPDCGGLYLLPRIVGLHKAKELMFTAQLINAETAYSLGIVNQIFEDDKLTEATYNFATELAQGPPIALGLIKKALNRSLELTLEDVLELEADLQTICMQTEDHREGVTAFKEKRKPVFKGE